MKQQLAVNIRETFFGSHNTSTLETPRGLINSVLPNIYIIAAIIVFLYMLFGGFTLISAGNNPDQMQNGQKILLNAIIGFALIFISYWIIQIIEVLTGLVIL